MAQQPLFRATSGLNNVIESHRLKYGEDGVCPLSKAVNVVVDNSGGVRRRNGRVQLFAGPCHSVWSWGPYCFFVSEGKLYRLMQDKSVVLVNDSCGDAEMFFEKFGSTVYCSNGVFRAILQDMTISSYSTSIPQKYRSDTRSLGIPSSFTRMCQHGGRFFVVDGRFIWESEPFNPRCFNLASGFFDVGSDCLGMVSVRGGIYISTEYDVRFYAGTCMEDFVPHDVCNYPAVKGTMCRIPGDQVFDGTLIHGIGAAWVTKKGLYVGDIDGRVFNLSSGKLEFESPQYGAACAIPGNIILSMEI